MELTNKKLSGKTRTEHDLLGNKEVPEEYYFGVQTLRAIENFNISRSRLNFFPAFIKGMAVTKEAAAMANAELGMMDRKIADAIVAACKKVAAGEYDDQFLVDMVQGGAGTSTNMNANEVIANVALEILGHKKGDYTVVHPNNHVNMAQSTNDAYPTGIHMALLYTNPKLVEALKELIAALRTKGVEFKDMIKMGRTQLQDAVPVTLGQEFEAYAVNLEEEIERLNETAKLFLAVNMGATAIGTGINSDPDYTPLCVKYLRQITEMDITAAPNFIEATNDGGDFVLYSSMLKRLSVKLSKMCNDLRLMSSGPRTGLGEINLPPMQPGSSIMPGKVNPVIPEVVNQVCFRVIGNDLTVTMAAEAGQLELNVMEPIIVYSLFESVEMLINAMNTLREKCIVGITANVDRMRNMVYHSIGLVTALNPYLGYETSTVLAKEALESGRGVYDLVLEKKLMSQEELDNVLKPEYMVKPRKLPKTK